jgi:flagellar assembly factor FliW
VTAAIGTADPDTEGGSRVDQELPEIRFVRPMPGFEDLAHFVLVRLGEDNAESESVLFELRSLEQPRIRFLVADPSAFFPDYTVELDEAACHELDLCDVDDALVLVVVTVGPDPTTTTANLLAPVVMNIRTRMAMQVILSGTDWPVRAAVV